MRTILALLWVALASSACGGASSSPDGSAAEPGLDAAAPADTGASLADASEPADAAAPTADAGEPSDASNACADAFAGCASFTDATGAAADRTISFTCCQYTPKCLKIAVGQSVTFSGSFSVHPLVQSCGPSEVILGASGSSADYLFDAAGLYGYYCHVHGHADGSGMAGAILVQ